MKYFLIIITILNSIITIAQTEPTGRRLRVIIEDLYANNSLIIGATTGTWAFGTNAEIVLNREYNYVTPENDFKQSTIHPNPNIWNWSLPDAWVQHITLHNQILRMHAPIGPQCSPWAKDPNRTATELEDNLCEFMQAVCERYNNHQGFKYIDVVNETVLQGRWRTDTETVYKKCPWYKIGQDTDSNQTPLYIKIAFQKAQQYASNLKFIFNQNSLETNDWNIIKQTIIYLRDLGLRVDGIGWQAHINAGWETRDNLNKLRNLIDWAQNNDLEFHITEMSVYIPDTSQSNLEEQADTYRAVINVLIEKRLTGKVGWNTWYLNDDEYTQWYPALFDSLFIAKPAYYAVQDELENGISGLSNYSNDKIVVYPNPARNIINIKGENILEIEIINSNGQVIKQVLNKDSFQSIDLSNQSKGFYYIRIKTKKNILTKKILLIDI